LGVSAGFRESRKAWGFYAITLCLAGLVAVAVPFIGETSLPITMLTPTLAAIVMLLVVAPEGSLRQAICSLGLTEAGLKAWPLAIAAPAAIHLVGVLVLLLTGLTLFAMPHIEGSPLLAAIDIVLGFVIGTGFALGEEIGWRGYMLPRLLGIGVVPAMLVVGFLHGLWHLPIMLTTPYYHNTGNMLIVVPMFLATLTLAGVFFGFLRIWSGSVWPVAIAHAAANFFWEFAARMTETKSAMALEYVGGESGIIMIVGLLIVDGLLLRKMKRASFGKMVQDWA
jgi:membrane protease YdiL (CAAX protease family)